jgi:hypothetical protein
MDVQTSGVGPGALGELPQDEALAPGIWHGSSYVS